MIPFALISTEALSLNCFPSRMWTAILFGETEGKRTQQARIRHTGRCTCRRQLLGKDLEMVENNGLRHSQVVGWTGSAPKSSSVQRSSSQGHTCRVCRLRGSDNHCGTTFWLSGSNDLFLMTHSMWPCLLFQQASSGRAQLYISLYLPQGLATAPTPSMCSIITQFNFTVKLLPGG